MARLVKHEKREPYRINLAEYRDKEALWICACGLSRNKPFCDGSHKRTRDEEEGELYLYDGEERAKVTNWY